MHMVRASGGGGGGGLGLGAGNNMRALWWGVYTNGKDLQYKKYLLSYFALQKCPYKILLHNQSFSYQIVH